MSLTPLTEQAVELADLGQEARGYLAASRSESTDRSYRTGWARFTAWADAHAVPSLPASPGTVALYVADLARTAKPATIDARLAAISAAHRAAGHESPTKAEPVRLVRRGVRRTVGTAQRQVRPVNVVDLRAMVNGLGDDVAGHRDRALLLLGFAGALRRSELVGLDVADMVEGPDGLTLTLRRSKTDPEGAGRTVGVPHGAHDETDPVRACQEWLSVSSITEGAVFRPIDRHGRVEREPTHRAIRRGHRQAPCQARWHRPRPGRRALAACWPRYLCGCRRCQRACHRSHDRAQGDCHASPVYPRGKPVPRERGRSSRPLGAIERAAARRRCFACPHLALFGFAVPRTKVMSLNGDDRLRTTTGAESVSDGAKVGGSVAPQGRPERHTYGLGLRQTGFRAHH